MKANYVCPICNLRMFQIRTETLRGRWAGNYFIVLINGVCRKCGYSGIIQLAPINEPEEKEEENEETD